MSTTSLLDANAAAVRASVDVVARAVARDLTRPTPCAGWDLETLLRHMTAQHRGFAAAASGRGADPTAWELPAAGPGVLTAYRDADDDVLAAFAVADVLDRPFRIPEFGEQPVPGRLAVGFHLVDYVVHGWDVARSLGAPFDPGADALAVTLPIVRGVPDDPARHEPGAAFAPARKVPGDAAPLTEILLLLGRDPAAPPS